MRTMFALSTPASTNRQRTGDGLATVLDKRGYAPSSMDIRQQNTGLWAAKHSAQDWAFWRQMIETATLQQGLAPWWWWWCPHFMMIPPRFYGEKWLSRDVHHARPAHRLSLYRYVRKCKIDYRSVINCHLIKCRVIKCHQTISATVRKCQANNILPCISVWSQSNTKYILLMR